MKTSWSDYNASYKIVAPGTEESQTVNSAPQATCVAFETKHFTGALSVSVKPHQALVKVMKIC